MEVVKVVPCCFFKFKVLELGKKTTTKSIDLVSDLDLDK